MTQERFDILLVEDNPHDVELALHAFRRHDSSIRVHVIRDGAEALDFFHCTGSYIHRNPDDLPKLILLDLKLPPVDGHYVLRQIRANPRTKTIPIVALTSSSQERDLLQCYQLGINSYIVKPVDFDRFVQATQMISQYWLKLNEWLVL